MKYIFLIITFFQLSNLLQSTPLDDLKRAIESNNIANAIQALNNGADPNASITIQTLNNGAYQTPVFHYAMSQGFFSLIPLFIEKGLNPNIEDPDGFFPLDKVIKKADHNNIADATAAVKSLINAGAQANPIRTRGTISMIPGAIDSPLTVATHKFLTPIVEILLLFRANIDHGLIKEIMCKYRFSNERLHDKNQIILMLQIARTLTQPSNASREEQVLFEIIKNQWPSLSLNEALANLPAITKTASNLSIDSKALYPCITPDNILKLPEFPAPVRPRRGNKNH